MSNQYNQILKSIVDNIEGLSKHYYITYIWSDQIVKFQSDTSKKIGAIVTSTIKNEKLKFNE